MPIKLTASEVRLLIVCLHEYIELVEQGLTVWETKESAGSYLKYRIKLLAEKLEALKGEVKNEN